VTLSKPQLALLLGVFAVSASLRFYLASFPASTDLVFMRVYSLLLADIGPVNYYLTDFRHWLPGFLYVLWAIGELREVFFAHVSNSTYAIILKMPANFFDMATAALIFVILSKRIQAYLAILGASLYLFNPAILYNSAVWGQFDGALTFFLLSSVYFLLQRKPEVSAALMAVAFLVKPQAIALIPVFALALVLRTPPKRVFLAAASALGVLLLLPLPFFWNDPFFGLISLTRDMSGFYDSTSLSAFNLWWIIGGWQDDGVTWLELSRQTWGFLLWLTAQGAVGFWLFKRPGSDWSVYWAGSLALFAFFILPTRIHERYLFPFLPFFLVSALLSRQKIALLSAYVSISLLHFLNLYVILQPEPYPIFEPIFSFARSHDLLISYLLVGSFAALLVTSFLLFLPLTTIGTRFWSGARLRPLPGRK
jgi:Gpi18-like mannosyltransferase